jgi:hypothetical protein
MKPHQATGPQPEADQTVRLQIDTAGGSPSIRIGFTDQRLRALGGMVLWSHVLHQKRFRRELAQVLPHDPTSPNAYEPTDIALGLVGGVLCGADKPTLTGIRPRCRALKSRRSRPSDRVAA